jgi:hypothetical protein
MFLEQTLTVNSTKGIKWMRASKQKGFLNGRPKAYE